MAEAQVSSSGQPGSPSGSGLTFSGRTRLRRLGEGTIGAVLFLCVTVSVLVTVGIIVALFSDAIGFFAREEVTLLEYLTGTTWQPLREPIAPGNFGVLPLINGTVLIAVIAGVIAIPTGLGSAVYLSEYAPENLRNAFKPLLELLAGVPTVVYGYFAISFVTPQLRNFFEWFNMTTGSEIEVSFFNAMSASIVVAVMIIPLVASISEDSMRAVPRSLREAAYGLGATKAEVSSRVVVPAALSGVLASFILALSRAVGETMATTIAAGATPRMTLNPLESVQTMTAFIVQVSFGDAPFGSVNSQSIYAVGTTLFLMTLLMNVVSNIIVQRFREEYD